MIFRNNTSHKYINSKFKHFCVLLILLFFSCFTNISLASSDIPLRTSPTKQNDNLKPEQYHKIIEISLNSNDLDSTKKLLEKALNKYPNDKELILQSITFFRKIGKLELAKELSEKFYTQCPEDIEINNVFGWLLLDYFYKTSKNEEKELFLRKASQKFQKALHFDPNSTEAALGIAKIEFLRGNFQESLDMLFEIRDKDRENSKVYYHIAHVYGSRCLFKTQSRFWKKQ